MHYIEYQNISAILRSDSLEAGSVDKDISFF